MGSEHLTGLISKWSIPHVVGTRLNEEDTVNLTVIYNIYVLWWTEARDDLEAEADAITDYLVSPGPNGEPMAGLKDSLIDNEGNKYGMAPRN